MVWPWGGSSIGGRRRSQRSRPASFCWNECSWTRWASPVTLLRALGDLGQPWADPVASDLAVMALTAETLVGHALVVLVLGSMGTLPGSMGRLAARLTSLITPVAARRLLDLLRAARCSPRRPWPCHQVHRMSIGGPPHTPGATASSPLSAEQALRRLLSPSSP